MKKTYLYILSVIVLLLNTNSGLSQTFVPNDSLIGNNFFQVEFSPDGNQMIWCEQILSEPSKAKVWATSTDKLAGLPNLNQKKLIDTIQGQGWPYWGQDNIGYFALFMNQHKEIKTARRQPNGTYLITNLGTINGQYKSLINVSRDSTKNYFYVSFVVISPDSNGLDSLFAFRNDNPSSIFFIASTNKSNSGSPYELTFPRWLANSELLFYPLKPFSNIPSYDLKIWDGSTQTSRQVTVDATNNPLNSHVDDFPYTFPFFPADTFLASSRGSRVLTIYKTQAGASYYASTNSYPTPTTITPYTLTSFEPFFVPSQRVFGAYQVYKSSGIPGTTEGEIWLQGIYGDTSLTRISNYSGVAVDPEYLIGPKKVWIFYYAKPVGIPSFFQLRRCETPIVLDTVQTSIDPIITEQKSFVNYDDVSKKLHFFPSFIGKVTIFDAQGKLFWLGYIDGLDNTISLAHANSGIYLVQTEVGYKRISILN